MPAIQMETKIMKYLIITKILIVLALISSPVFAIKKCTEKYTVGYAQFECPETAIKSEVYVDKIGAPPRNPMPRYVERPGDKSKQTTVIQKAKSGRKAITKPSEKISPIDSDNEE